MAFHVRDREVDQMVRKLASREGLGITEAIRVAVRERLKVCEPTFQDKLELRRASLRAARIPRTDTMTDKEFYDSLNDIN